MANPRLLARLASRLRYELASLVADARHAWRMGRRPWIAGAMCVLSAACALAERFSAARPALARAGDVYANLPVENELVRMPLSVFLPTADLPLWGAVLQTAVVVGLAELVAGRLGTIVVASAGQLLSTLTSRYLIALGTAVLIGLPLSQAGVLDTGPSGISTAVGGWLLARRGAYASLALLILAIAAAAAIQTNLDGREHAAALAVGVAAAGVQAPALRALPRRVVRGFRSLADGGSEVAKARVDVGLDQVGEVGGSPSHWSVAGHGLVGGLTAESAAEVSAGSSAGPTAAKSR